MKTGVPIKSTRKNKKLMVLTPKGNIIHFGDSSMKDFTQHKDKKRQKSYCSRSAGIKSKGKLTKNNKESANYYARKYLWDCDNV
jgi:hypothetical protein